MTQAAKHFVDLDRVRLSYVTVGQPGAPTIVLAHSLFLNKAMFDPLADQLKSDFQVVAYDARGHGSSSRSDDDRYDMEAYYDDAAGFIEALAIGPVHFGGNSMGGWTALRLASRRPDLVHSVIAMGSSGEGESDLHAFDPVIKHLKAHGGSGLEESFAHIFFGDASLASEEFSPVREYWLRHMSQLSPFYARPGASVAFRSGVNAELKYSDVPVLAIAGAQDHVFPVALSENIARSARRGNLIVIEGAGHSVAMERPGDVSAAIRSFIAHLGETD